MKPPPKPRTPSGGPQDGSQVTPRQTSRPAPVRNQTPPVTPRQPRRISSTVNAESESIRKKSEVSRVDGNSSESVGEQAKDSVGAGEKSPSGAKSRFAELSVSRKAGQMLSASTKSVLPKVEVLSTGVADRLAEREAVALHDRRKKQVIWIGLILLVAVAFYLFGISKFFAVDLDQVEVVGVQKYVSRDEVIKALSEHEYVPLARLDLSSVNQDLLGIKNVKSATQKRSWPQGVSVAIVERVPVAAVPTSDSFTLLDIDAVEVSSVAEAPEGLPVIKIPITGENRKTLATALAILDSLPTSMLVDIGSITASTQDDIEFTLRDGIIVQWGNSADTALKFEVLERLRPIALEEKKKTIDLSAPTFPIIRK